MEPLQPNYNGCINPKKKTLIITSRGDFSIKVASNSPIIFFGFLSRNIFYYIMNGDKEKDPNNKC